jgi:cation:H+ antiporter
MITDILLVGLGLLLLLGGGEALVRGAVSLARLAGVPALLIGLTVVAFGTSAPELVVSVQAVLSGDNGIAIGNIVGSNIANVLMVLGLPALIAPIALTSPGLRRHALVMLLATAAFAYVIYGYQTLDTVAGATFLVLIGIYILYIGINAMRPDSPDAKLLESEVIDDLDEHAETKGGVLKTVLFVVIGLIGLPLGGSLLVSSGSDLAADLGVREELIGLTVVAFGTSLPELATVIAAARKGEAEVAVGNVIGSNIFNILFVGGAAGLAGTTIFSVDTRLVDMPVMIAAALLLAVLVFQRARLGRLLGLLFAAGYIAYIVYISGGVVEGLAG